MSASLRLNLILKAVNNILGFLPLTYLDLVDLKQYRWTYLISQLFIHRPMMTAHCQDSQLSDSFDYISRHMQTLSNYLTEFTSVHFKQMDYHLLQINKGQPELMFHCGRLSDTEQVYWKVRVMLAQEKPIRSMMLVTSELYISQDIFRLFGNEKI